MTKIKYRAEAGAVGEHVWSTTAMRFDTLEEAQNHAKDLASRWFGANVFRAVPDTTPQGENIDLPDPQIVKNFRSCKEQTSIKP